MIIGGLQSMDFSLLGKPAKRQNFPLLFDKKGEYKRVLWTNNGRTATVYALENGVQCGPNEHVLVPDYLCVSVLNAFEEAGTPFKCYRVDRNLQVDVEDLRKKIDDKTRGIYLIHYFGQPHSAQTAQAVQELAHAYGIPILEDITQTLFSYSEGRMGYGDYVLCSTRKWFPVTDGGLLAVRQGAALRTVKLLAGYNKDAYNQLLLTCIRQQADARQQPDMDQLLEMERMANRTRYENLRPCQITEASKSIMLNFDVEELCKKRRENYQTLYERLYRLPDVQIFGGEILQEANFVPFGMLVLVEEQERFFDFLAREKKIVGEIQWVLPVEKYNPGEAARRLSKHNLMLHCDQRYGKAEMERTAEAVEAFFSI